MDWWVIGVSRGLNHTQTAFSSHSIHSPQEMKHEVVWLHKTVVQHTINRAEVVAAGAWYYRIALRAFPYNQNGHGEKLDKEYLFWCPLVHPLD